MMGDEVYRGMNKLFVHFRVAHCVLSFRNEAHVFICDWESLPYLKFVQLVLHLRLHFLVQSKGCVEAPLVL